MCEIKMKLFFNLINFKFTFRIGSLFASVLLFGVTAAFTYKAYVELLEFTKIEFLNNSHFFRVKFAYIVALFVALATLIQSFTVIWDRMSYWGQCIDNWICLLILHKKYFLDESQSQLNEVHKTINTVNRLLQKYTWNTLTDPQYLKNNDAIKNEIKFSIDDSMKSVIKKFHHLNELISSHKAKDNTNQQKQNKTIEQLNELTVNITETLRYLREIKQHLSIK